MDRRAHELGNLKGGSTPPYHIFLDTEAAFEDVDDKTQRQYLRLGCAEYVDRRYDGSYRTDDKITYFDLDSFYDWLETKIRKNNTTWIWAHNMSYDMRILHMFEEMPLRGWELTKCIMDSNRCIIKWKRDKTYCEWISSTNYFKLPLRKIGQILKEYKGEVDFHTASDEELAKYCMQDVNVLKKLMLEFFDLIDRHGWGKLKETAASQSMSIFRTAYKIHDIFIHTDKDAINLEREAYKGGRTECFKIGRWWGHFWDLDINSMYPSVMRDNLFPTKLISVRNSTSIEELKHWMKEHYVIARVKLAIDKPCFGIKGERFIFPIGKYTTTLCHNELEYALDGGYLVGVEQFAIYEQAPIFKEYIEDLYNLRMQAKKSKNEIYVLAYKLFMNSLYGKFGQRKKDSKCIGTCDIEDIYSERIYDLEADDWTIIRCYGGKIYQERNTEEESFNSFPAIAAAVTAYARMKLWGYIEKAGLDNVYYCDTDSVFVNLEGMQRLVPYMDDYELGMLKTERKEYHMQINAPKDYVFGNQVKLKGVNPNWKSIDGTTFTGEKFSQPISQLKTGTLNDVYIYKSEKTLKREYKKGIVQADGSVEPFMLDEYNNINRSIVTES